MNLASHKLKKKKPFPAWEPWTKQRILGEGELHRTRGTQCYC